MTFQEIDDLIVRTITDDPWITIGMLKKRMATYMNVDGDQVLELRRNLVLQTRLSPEFADGLLRCLNAGRFRVYRIGLLLALAFADHPGYPIAEDVKRYKTPHWLPVMLAPADASGANGRTPRKKNKKKKPRTRGVIAANPSGGLQASGCNQSKAPATMDDVREIIKNHNIGRVGYAPNDFEELPVNWTEEKLVELVKQVNVCEQFLRQVCPRPKGGRANERRSSYGLKHDVEKSFGGYVLNSALIIAALHLEMNICPGGPLSPNGVMSVLHHRHWVTVRPHWATDC